MTGMPINLHTWRGFTEIDIAVDHKAVVQKMKAKHEPVSDQVATLLDKMSYTPLTHTTLKVRTSFWWTSRVASSQTAPIPTK